MADTPRGYRRETYEIFIKKNADLSNSQKQDGLKSALARDRRTNDLSHALLGDRVQTGSNRTQRVSPSTDRERSPADVSESAPEISGLELLATDRDRSPVVVSESAPEISGLVPLALVVVAGIAVGAVGIKVAQSAKNRRAAQVGLSSVGPSSAAPAGWYEVAGDPTRLRYWTGLAWTDDYAQRAGSAPQVAADWYPDPSNAAQLRYWDGRAWTHHVSTAPGAVSTPADWYPDPSRQAQLRYWDGNAWTSHITNGPGVAGHQQIDANTSGSELVPAHSEPKINMSSAEWKAHVEAWLRVGAIQQELWHRLSNANIQDADDATLEAQRRMDALTPEEGARRTQLMLEANPALREQGSLLDLMRLFSGGAGAQLGVETNYRREGSR